MKRVEILSRLRGLFEIEGRGRVLPMEGMRGLACLLVFGVHYANHFKAWASPGGVGRMAAGVIEVAGQAGVDVFFGLSGYLVYGLALRHEGALWPFVRRRLRRIYPAFLAVLALYLALFAVWPERAKWPEAGRVEYAVINALLIPGVFDLTPAVTVSWSLSYELLFYMTVPLLVRSLRLREWTPARRLLLVGALAGGYTALAFALFPGTVEGLPFHAWKHPRLLLFTSGMAAWELGQMGWGTRVRPGWAVAAMGAALAATVPLADSGYQQPWPDYTRAALLGAGSLLVTLAAYHRQGWLAGGLSFAPLRWLGNCSYSFYLVHALGVQAAALGLARATGQGTGGEWIFWAMAPAALAAALAAAVPLYLLVERPLSQRRR